MPYSLEPIVTEIANGWEFAYVDAHEDYPVVQLRNITRTRSGDIIGELDAFCMLADMMTPVSGIRFNLTSLQTRGTIAKSLKANYLDISATYIEWERIIPDVCLRVLKLYRNGTSVEEIWPSDEIIIPQFLIKPILPLHQPCIIFGEGGAGKGLVALTLSILARLPYEQNPLKLTTLTTPTSVLYGDYESDREEFERILSGLCNGLGEAVPLKRLQMTRKLSDMVEQLRKRILEDSIGLLIIDSLAPAAGISSNDPSEAAVELFRAIRSLPPITTLIIAHQSKDTDGKRKRVYGSVFYENLARSVWEVRKSQEVGDSEMVLSLSHTKFNRKQELPIGLKYSFDDEHNIITVKQTDLAITPLSGQLPVSFQIKDLLRSGPETVNDMAETLSVTTGVVRVTLNRMLKNESVTRLEDGRWGLQARNDQ